MKINRRQLAKTTLLGTAGLQIKAQAPEAAITHGPFLGQVGLNDIWIWARTSRAGSFRIRYGAAADRMDQVSAPVKTDIDHDNAAWLRITGLRPGTRYFYRIDGTTAADRSGTFVT